MFIKSVHNTVLWFYIYASLINDRQVYPIRSASFGSTVPGADPGGAHPARAPPPKIGKNDFLAYNRDFSHEIPPKFSRLPPLGTIFLSAPP